MNARNYSKAFMQELSDWFLELSDNPNPSKWLPIFINREHVQLESRRKLTVTMASRYVHLEDAHVLDTGCETGRNSVLLAEKGAKVTGLDVEPRTLKVAASRCKEHSVSCDFKQGSVVKTPFSDEQFDLVIFQNVLEHLPGSEQLMALREMMRVLKKDGVLFIQTPNKWSPYDIHTSRLPFVHWLPRKVSGLLEHAGIQPPKEDLLSYNTIIKILRTDSDITVCNHCDAWESLLDYRENWVNYAHAFNLAAKLYFRIVPVGYIISKIFRFELNKWLPILTFIIRKV